jgi:hypothetical protein
MSSLVRENYMFLEVAFTRSAWGGMGAHQKLIPKSCKERTASSAFPYQIASIEIRNGASSLCAYFLDFCYLSSKTPISRPFLYEPWLIIGKFTVCSWSEGCWHCCFKGGAVVASCFRVEMHHRTSNDLSRRFEFRGVAPRWRRMLWNSSFTTYALLAPPLFYHTRL